MVALRSSSRATMCFAESWLERHLDHAHGAFDDPGTSIDDGARLLAPQHRVGDLGGIGEVADARVHHLDAGLLEAALHLRLQLLADLVGVAAQRQLVAVGFVRV